MEYNQVDTIGYEYDSLSAAKADRTTINNACHSEGASTTEFASIIKCAVNKKWFILHQDYMTPIIGEPKMIQYFTIKTSINKT